MAQKDGDFYCLWVNRIGEVSELAFGLIRRNALPQAESAGNLKNLMLAEKEGLCEVSHMCICPTGVIGVEYNHYGPRASRFAEYVKKVARGESPDFAVEALMNHDTANRIARKVAVRIMELKVRRPYIESIKEMDSQVGDALDALAQGSNADTVGVMLGPEPWQKINLGNSMMDFIRRMVGRKDLREIAVKFTAHMVDEGKEKADEINLLQDQLDHLSTNLEDR